LGRCPKTKNPLTFQVEGFGKQTCCLIYFPKPPVSFSIAYPNDGRVHVQPLNSGRCFCITLDMFNEFITESYLKIYLPTTNNLTTCKTMIYLVIILPLFHTLDKFI
jgi:hypothetical protein